VPQTAQVVVCGVVVLLVVAVDVRTAIGFSSFGVLVYYAVANAAAFTQDDEHRRFPRALQAIGFAACLTLVGTLPLSAVIAGLIVFAAGIAARLLTLRRR
jgi:APA family basic amino acid/polyamine antiporter